VKETDYILVSKLWSRIQDHFIKLCHCHHSVSGEMQSHLNSTCMQILPTCLATWEDRHIYIYQSNTIRSYNSTPSVLLNMKF